MASAKSKRFNDPWLRGILYQTLLVIAVSGLIGSGAYNAYFNMRARGIPLGFGFWNQVAGFDINLHLIDYSPLSTYGRAFWVGLLNTLLVASICIPLATLFGFAIGVARLAPNWLLSRSALVYTNVIRNTPLLLQLLFCYNAVLKSLPGPRQSMSLAGAIYLNNRGLFLPAAVVRSAATWFVVAVALSLAAAMIVRSWAARRRDRTGAQAPVAAISVALILGGPSIALLGAGAPLTFTVAKLSGFNLKGGIQVIPEMAALILSLVVFTAAFIAEIVRAGVQAVPHGQSEAALALGLHRSLMMKLVVIPQALRLIVPPLTSQYLNVVKNSSLAVFVGYPDLVQIFAGTVLNQTQAAVQVMSITMAVYLFISLMVAAALNAFNASYAWKEKS
ncbi:MAG: ABC transporter permease subunit [Roseiarcus sp.]|uniref:amino acid ABC transporter permease n=1 Tax=Roseiarcus sp. TaxID=1969460 RepID=UPI003BB0D02E